MGNLPEHPDDVKSILTPFDPRTGNYIVNYKTDNGLITVPAFFNKIDPFSLLYRPGEIDGPGLFAHEAGFAAFYLEDLTISLPHKDLDGFPLPLSRPAHFNVIIWEPDKPITLPGLPSTDILILFSRNVQKGEVSHADITNLLKMAQQMKHGRCIYPPRSPESTPTEPIIQPPPEAWEKLDPETPASEKLKLALHKIPTQFFALPQRYGHPFVDCAVYAIFRWFPTGKKGPDSKHYCNMGIDQLIRYLCFYKEILIRHPLPEIREQARKMGTSSWAVKYAKSRLLDSGLVVVIIAGKPGEYCSKHIVSRDDKERDQNMPLARRVKAKIRMPHTVLKNPDQPPRNQ